MFILKKTNIFTRSHYLQFVAYFIIDISAMVFGYKLDICPLYKKLEVLQQKIITIKKQLQKQAAQKNSTLSTSPGLDNPQSVAKTEIFYILATLEQATTAAQTNLILFEPQTIQEDELFFICPVKLEARGVYKNLLMFINNMLQSFHLVAIEEINIQKGKENDSDDLGLQIQLVIYKNKSPIAKNKSFPLLPISERNLFKYEVYKKNLYLWSNKELRFLGLIKKDRKTFGVISDPLGGVYQVTVGDQIGLNQSKIIAIDKCGITTTKHNDNIHAGEKCI